MAERKKTRKPRMSPETAKRRRKETYKTYAQTRHAVRLSKETWQEWNSLKDASEVSTHDEFAVRLLQAW
jgi:hypothetical protein